MLLSGCIQAPLPPIIHYTLNTPEVQPAAHSPYKDLVLQVDYPQSLTLPAGERLYFSYSAMERGMYQNAYWATAVGRMLQAAIITSLERAKIFKAVLPYSSEADANIRLESTIYDLSHHVRGKNSYAVLSIGFTLIDAERGTVIRTKRFSYKVATATIDAKGYVEAMDQALSQMIRDLIFWLQK